MDGVLLLFVAIAMIVLPVKLVMNSNQRKEELREDEYEDEGLEYEGIKYFGNFIGGFKDIGYCEFLRVDFFKDRIGIEIKDLKKDIKENRYIKLNDVLDVKIQTETQIKESVSIGKLLVFGILSFGMKGNEKTLIDEYVVMKVVYNNDELNLIFKMSDSYNFIKDINRFKEEYL
ncbi:hypothetical protein [uncultured Clostridium sp.]|uniref:hypothetical protein n=1 Tax=uncultured Clostridium sp. TaxID=59620 RepID=UPI0032164313